MDQTDTAMFRAHLVDRRERLRTAVSDRRNAADFVNLLKEVDSAIERLDAGSYGICEICSDAIESDHLRQDPLVRVCLSHLSEDRQRAIERDLELASAIQRKLLPARSLVTGGWEIAFHYEPAGPVSGDYCDIIRDEKSGAPPLFFIGDVSGKGVAASLLMSHLHAIIRSISESERSIARLVERANRVFSESTLSLQFATAACGRAFTDGSIELCVAGHCPPLVVHADRVTAVEASGLPLGIMFSAEYAERRVRLERGDAMMLYTDGLTESRNDQGEEYGENRLRHVLASLHGSAASRILAACLDDLRVFRGATPPADDLTVLVLQRPA